MSGSLTHSGGENVPGIPGVCTTRNFAYLARAPWYKTRIFDLRTSHLLLSNIAYVTHMYRGKEKEKENRRTK